VGFIFGIISTASEVGKVEAGEVSGRGQRAPLHQLGVWGAL